MLETIVGLLSGFITSIPPMGPIAVIILRRALLRKFREGLSIAIGSAVAEMIYAMLALFGLDALLGAYPFLTEVFRWLGVVILVGLGSYFLVSDIDADPDEDEDEDESSHEKRKASKGLALGFSVAILNPTLPLTWSAAVGAMVAHPLLDFTWWSKITFPVAVAIGIVAWFALLLWMFHRWGNVIQSWVVRVSVRVAGLGLLAIAVWYGYQIITM